MESCCHYGSHRGPAASFVTIAAFAGLLCYIPSGVLAQCFFVYPVGDPNKRPTQVRQNPNGYRIVQGFRINTHTGVDLGNAKYGGEVRAITQGTVTRTITCGDSKGSCGKPGGSKWGNAVLIRHDLADEAYYSLYAHMMDGSISVNTGDPVGAGTTVGKVGSTGNSTGPHLHFAVKRQNNFNCAYIRGSCAIADSFDNYEDPLQFIADQRAGRFVDNGNGTITDTCTGLMWEKKDSGHDTPDPDNLHDVDNRYSWAGCCDGSCYPWPDQFCQPNAAAAAACNEQTGGAVGCAQCASGTCDVNPYGEFLAITTIWDWLAQINAEGGTGFAGYSDWRIPLEDGRNKTGCAPSESCPHGVVCPGCAPQELETILLEPFPCGSWPCVDPVFYTNCGVGCTVTTCSCTAGGDVWSATTITFDNYPYAWCVNFSYGNVYYTDYKYSWNHYVRAVRGGP